MRGDKLIYTISPLQITGVDYMLVVQDRNPYPNPNGNYRVYRVSDEVKGYGTLTGRVFVHFVHNEQSPFHNGITYTKDRKPFLSMPVNYAVIDGLVRDAEPYRGRISAELAVPERFHTSVKPKHNRREERMYIELTKTAYNLLIAVINAEQTEGRKK